MNKTYLCNRLSQRSGIVVHTQFTNRIKRLRLIPIPQNLLKQRSRTWSLRSRNTGKRIRADILRQRPILGRSQLSNVVTAISAHEDERIRVRGHASKTSEMTNSVSGRREEVITTIVEVVESLELADGEYATTLVSFERKLAQLAARIIRLQKRGVWVRGIAW
jgi:hypothetical protein